MTSDPVDYIDDVLYGYDQSVSIDAMRCRPADAEPVILPTWQPAYAGPPPPTDPTPYATSRRQVRPLLTELVDYAAHRIFCWLTRPNP